MSSWAIVAHWNRTAGRTRRSDLGKSIMMGILRVVFDLMEHLDIQIYAVEQMLDREEISERSAELPHIVLDQRPQRVLLIVPAE